MNFTRLHLLLALSISAICISIDAKNPKRPWTFLVYMAADNNLNPEADENIAQMVQASHSTNGYILVYLNIKRSGQSKRTQKLVIQNGQIHQEGPTTVEDSGDENTLIKALTWAVTEYPSDHLIVDLWNHGSGSLNRRMQQEKGVCYDDTTGNYLTDLKYKRAFDIIVNQHLAGKKIDIITFDACLMADIEVAYTLMPYAHYLVSSQETVPGPGFDYTSILSLFEQTNPDAETLAKWMVKTYDNYYKNSGQAYTLSAVNLDKLTPAVNSLNAAANLLTTIVSSDATGTVANVITTVTDPSVCPHFDEPTYLDLYNVYANLMSNIAKMKLSSITGNQLKKTLRSAMSNLAYTVIANVHSKNYAKVRGLSIYLCDLNVGIEPSYNNLYWTTQNPSWLNFLQAYVNAATV